MTFCKTIDTPAVRTFIQAQHEKITPTPLISWINAFQICILLKTSKKTKVGSGLLKSHTIIWQGCYACCGHWYAKFELDCRWIPNWNRLFCTNLLCHQHFPLNPTPFERGNGVTELQGSGHSGRIYYQMGVPCLRICINALCLKHLTNNWIPYS